jgi:hypothetical protein
MEINSVEDLDCRHAEVPPQTSSSILHRRRARRAHDPLAGRHHGLRRRDRPDRPGAVRQRHPTRTAAAATVSRSATRTTWSTSMTTARAAGTSTTPTGRTCSSTAQWSPNGSFRRHPRRIRRSCAGRVPPTSCRTDSAPDSTNPPADSDGAVRVTDSTKTRPGLYRGGVGLRAAIVGIPGPDPAFAAQRAPQGAGHGAARPAGVAPSGAAMVTRR